MNSNVLSEARRKARLSVRQESQNQAATDSWCVARGSAFELHHQIRDPGKSVADVTEQTYCWSESARWDEF